MRLSSTQQNQIQICTFRYRGPSSDGRCVHATHTKQNLQKRARLGNHALVQPKESNISILDDINDFFFLFLLRFHLFFACAKAIFCHFAENNAKIEMFFDFMSISILVKFSKNSENGVHYHRSSSSISLRETHALHPAPARRLILFFPYEFTNRIHICAVRLQSMCHKLVSIFWLFFENHRLDTVSKWRCWGQKRKKEKSKPNGTGQNIFMEIVSQ